MCENKLFACIFIVKMKTHAHIHLALTRPPLNCDIIVQVDVTSSAAVSCGCSSAPSASHQALTDHVVFGSGCQTGQNEFRLGFSAASLSFFPSIFIATPSSLHAFGNPPSFPSCPLWLFLLLQVQVQGQEGQRECWGEFFGSEKEAIDNICTGTDMHVHKCTHAKPSFNLIYKVQLQQAVVPCVCLGVRVCVGQSGQFACRRSVEPRWF